MKKHFLLFVSLLLLFVNIQAQVDFKLHLKSGFAFNPKIDLNHQLVKNSRGVVIDFGGTFKIPIYKKLFSEIGLGGRTIFSTGNIEDIEYDAKTLRLLQVTQFGFQLSKRWEISTGLIFQNNKDFTKTKFEEKYFWRVNHVVLMRYAIAPKWYFTSEWSFDLRNVPDPYLINDPKFLMLVGLAKRL